MIKTSKGMCRDCGSEHFTETLRCCACYIRWCQHEHLGLGCDSEKEKRTVLGKSSESIPSKAQKHENLRKHKLSCEFCKGIKEYRVGCKKGKRKREIGQTLKRQSLSDNSSSPSQVPKEGVCGRKSDRRGS